MPPCAARMMLAAGIGVSGSSSIDCGVCTSSAMSVWPMARAVIAPLASTSFARWTTESLTRPARWALIRPSGATLAIVSSLEK